MARVLTVGETMALLDPVADGPLERGSSLTLRIAGAESNLAVALCRLGVQTTWISRLGDDPLGEIVRETLAGEGVDLSHLRIDPGAPTGLYLKWRETGRSHVTYYRRGSAASRLRPEDVPDAALDGVEAVHLTGITMALGEGPRRLVADLASRARERGVTVVFDPNLRPALWRTTDEAAETYAAVLPAVDWYLCGFEEGCTLFHVETERELLEAIEASGPRNAAVRVGRRGALVRDASGAIAEVPPLRLTTVLDEIGAGDGFAAGFLYGLLHGWTTEASARTGNLIAAAALAGTGDWETLPRLEEVEEDLLAIGGPR